jgi:hypothetical protein
MTRFPFDWSLASRIKSHQKTKTLARGHIAILEVAPLNTDIDGILEAVTLTTAKDVATGFVTGIAAALLACPQLVTITGTKAGGALTGDVVIHGEDICGNTIADTIALNDDATVPGVYAFAKVTSVHFPAKTTTGDTVKVGLTKAIGIPFISGEVQAAYSKTLDGSADTGAFSYDAAAVGKSIYTPSGTPNGSKLLNLSLVVANLD